MFNLVGESLRNFRAEMAMKPPPKTINEVIRLQIPPKGIKRGKNIEGTELFDGEELEEFHEDEDEEADEFPADQLLEALSGSIPVEIVNQEPAKESNAVTGNTVSLVGISRNEEINKDAKFLDEIRKVFDSCETVCTVYATTESTGNSLPKRKGQFEKTNQ